MADGTGSSENDANQHLPELILRRLKENDPLRPVLKQDLELRLAHIPPDSHHESVQALTSWLEEHPAKPERSLLGLTSLAVVLFLGCLAWLTYEHLPLLGAIPGAPSMLKQAARERIFVSGRDGSFTNAQEYAEQLLQADPDNPVLYFGYVQSYISRHRFPPPDFHETWNRIDPGNGIWAVCEGESILAGSNTSFTVSSRELALRLFLEAAEKPQLHFYREEWLNYFRKHLSIPHSLPEFLATRSQLIMVDPRLHLTLPNAPMVLRQQLARPDGESPIAYRKVLDWIETETNIPEDRALPLNWDATIPAVQAYVACWSILALTGLLLISAFILHLRKIPSHGEAGKLVMSLNQLFSRSGSVKILILTLPVPVCTILTLFAICRNEIGLAILPLLLVPAAWLAILTTLIALCDSQISRRTGIFGFNSSKKQRHLNAALCVLAYLSFLPALALTMGNTTVFTVSSDERVLILSAGITSAVIIISLSTKILLGYTSPEPGIRHRLIARRLLLVTLAMVVLLSALALILHGMERTMIHNIVATEWTGEKPF